MSSNAAFLITFLIITASSTGADASRNIRTASDASMLADAVDREDTARDASMLAVPVTAVAAVRVEGADEKPIRIRNVFHKREKKDPRVEGVIGDMECGVTVVVTSKDDKNHICPRECPLYAQDRTDELHCTFVCTVPDNCAKWNPNKPIPDFKLGACRAPAADFCNEYNLEDATDTCKVCQSGYRLGEDGQCRFKYFFLLYILLVVFIVILVFVVVWVTDLIVRPVTNQQGLDDAEALRSRQKIRQNEEGRPLWPLTTNLLRVNVAGPGMMLHFNFQAAVIVWALFVAIVWVIMATVIDNDLFILGTRRFGSPRDNCILVAWGYETQQRLMWTKVTFLAIIYTCTFALALMYGVRQLRLFQVFDYDNKTSKDFVAVASGLPPLSGKDKVEDDLKKHFAAFAGVPVVGVSVAWEYKKEEQVILEHLDKMLDAADKKEFGGGEAVEMPFHRKQLFNLEQWAFGEDEQEEGAEQNDDKKIKEVLDAMKSSRYCYVSFETEHARDAAIAKAEREGGVDFQGQKLELSAGDAEPDTVLWKNYDGSSGWAKVGRLLVGMGCILLGLVFWTVVFYAPYAWSVFNFNYDNGQEPGFVYGLSFSMVVVVGNAIMYEICNRVSDYVGFKFGDQREAIYMILYTIACTFNIAMDGFTTYYTALYVMSGLDFRTYHGRRIADIDQFHNQFDTYAMQRSLAQNTFAYAFPSTYLIPFIIEPFATIYLPWKIGQLIVRSHPEIMGRAAEELLACMPMDLGRYADLLLDIVLGVLIFYFPGGYTHKLFFAMAGCHLYIYAFDQFKVLRGIPTVTYASIDVDWWSQAMLAPICGMILACLVFKGNGQGYGYDIGGLQLVEVCTCFWALHCVVHIALLKYFVPMFGKKDEENEALKDITFAQHQAGTPMSFFSTNPVHCLRSQLIYQDKPHCCYVEAGREHLIKPNPKIGCCFDGTKRAPKGDEEDEMSYAGLKRLATQATSQIWKATDSP